MCCNFDNYSLKEKEISNDLFINMIKNSKISAGVMINISGGEPFLKDGVGDLILELNELGISCCITTNGTFPDKIEYVLKSIKNKNIISFAISIDGIAEIHNRIRGRDCFDKALSSLFMMKKYGVLFQVNTVIQRDNIDYLAYMQKFWADLSINQILIPKLNCGPSKFDYSKTDCEVMYPYLRVPFYRKYIASEGRFMIRECNAGEKNCAIDPYGNVYACCSGYQIMNIPENLWMGNIVNDNLDDIIVSDQAKEAIRKGVKNCKGCYSGCEVNRECNMFDLDCSLDANDLLNVSKYIQNTTYLDEISIDNKSWHALEYSEIGSFRWMAEKKSRYYIKSIDSEKTLYMKIMNVLEENFLTIHINDKRVFSANINLGTNEINIPLDGFEIQNGYVYIVELEVSKIFKPSSISNSDDHRTLGMALYHSKLI
jgi:MoaA/NifB/PqqE/SkfB family radical SAM enzyme